jgi:uncharacterized protein with gpF-like domain
MTITCLLNTAPMDIHFEVNSDYKISSAAVWKDEESYMQPFDVTSEKISEQRISFTAKDNKGENLLVDVDLNDANYGNSTIQIGKVSENTACFIGVWEK